MAGTYSKKIIKQQFTTSKGPRKPFSLVHSVKIIWRIFAYAKSYWLLILLSNILMLGSSALSVMTPKYSGKVIDTITGSSTKGDLIELIKSVSLVYLASSLLEIVQGVVQSIVSKKVKQEMKEDFFDKLLRKDVEFYDSKKTGELISTLNSDINQAQKVSTGDFTQILKQLVEIVASVGVLYSMSPSLTILILTLIPPQTYLIAQRGYYIKSFQKILAEIAGNISSIAVEALSNIRVVKSFGAEQKELNAYKERLTEYSKLQNELAWKSSGFSLMLTILARITHAVILWHGGCLVLEGRITPGELSSFLLYGNNLNSATKVIKKYVDKFAMSLGSCERVFEMMDHQVKINTGAKGKKISKLKGAIKLEDVHFSYPSRPEVPVLKGINIDIKSGETVALVGSSGSGKSTLVGLLERFYDPTKGNIYVDGVNLKELELDWLHRKLGYVSQEPALFSGTIEKNITYGVQKYTEEDIREAIKMANAQFIYDKKHFPDGLKTIVGERGAKLSGGQKQRLAIARALIKHPRILIFDEATSALDAESEHQVQDAIKSLMMKKDRTVIIIAHRLSTIMSCQRILVFDKGRVIEQGTHKELIKMKGYYKQLIDRQLNSQQSLS